MNMHSELSPFGTARPPGRPPASPEAERMCLLVAHLSRRIRSQFSLEPEVVTLALEPVQWLSNVPPAGQEALVVLVLASLLNLRAGSTRLPLFEEEGRSYLRETLGVLLDGAALPPPGPVSPAPDAILAAVDRLLEERLAPDLIGDPRGFSPLVFARPHLYVQRMLALEDRFVERIGHLVERPDRTDRFALVDRCLEDVLSRPPVIGGREIRPSDEQRRAVRTSLLSPVAVISGGPGTGKTTIVLTILRVLCRMGMKVEEIALAAPTGKAANRIAESVLKGLKGIGPLGPEDQELLEKPPEARTLHRLLGYSPTTDRFKHHENNRLSHSFVIVDEGSMVDLFLMERVVRSLADSAQLVLLGDAEQLPSVEAGAVLRDLVWPKESPPLGGRAVRLLESHRQVEGWAGRSILAVADAINGGDISGLFGPRADGVRVLAQRSQVGDLRFDEGVEFLAPCAGVTVDEFLDAWYARFVRESDEVERLMCKEYAHGPDGFGPEDRSDLDVLVNHLERARILCITHAHRSGAERVNALLHRRLSEVVGSDAPFCAGEPVMMLKNDYDRMVFNGDQGLVLRVATEAGRSQPMAIFPRNDGYGLFHLDSLKGLIAHSFAITVHKSQGSEFDHVALLLPETDLPLNTRELLYTAVTRAKRSVAVFGSRWIFEAGARRRIRRFSGIAEKLANSYPTLPA